MLTLKMNGLCSFELSGSRTSTLNLYIPDLKVDRTQEQQLTMLKICCHFVGYAKLEVLGKVQWPLLYMTSKK